MKPFKTPIIATTIDINKVIVTIAPKPDPIQIITIGPNAILGRAFSTTKYGSATFLVVSLDHKIIAIITPSKVPIVKPI